MLLYGVELRLSILIHKFAFPLEDALGNLKEFRKLFRCAEFSKDAHRGARELWLIEGTKDTTHENIVPLKNVYNFMMTIRKLVKSKHLGTTRDCDFHSYISLRDNIIDTESALEYFLRDRILLLLIRLRLKKLKLFIEYTRVVLINTVRYIRSNTCT